MKNILNNIVFALSLVFSIMLIGCKSEYEKNLSKMNEACIKSWKDAAFKGNGTIDIIEYKGIDYTVKDENYVDSLRIIANYDKITHFDALYKEYLEKAKDVSHEIKVYGVAFGYNSDLVNIKKEELKELESNFDLYQDSLFYYIRQDSIIRDNIRNRVHPSPVYVYRAYMKAVLKDNNIGTTNNYLDTMTVWFDKDFKLIR